MCGVSLKAGSQYASQQIVLWQNYISNHEIPRIFGAIEVFQIVLFILGLAKI